MKVGHNAKPRETPPRIRIDVTGQTFGKWTLLGFWKREGALAIGSASATAGVNTRFHSPTFVAASQASVSTAAGKQRPSMVDHNHPVTTSGLTTETNCAKRGETTARDSLMSAFPNATEGVS